MNDISFPMSNFLKAVPPRFSVPTFSPGKRKKKNIAPAVLLIILTHINLSNIITVQFSQSKYNQDHVRSHGDAHLLPHPPRPPRFPVSSHALTHID